MNNEEILTEALAEIHKEIAESPFPIEPRVIRNAEGGVLGYMRFVAPGGPLLTIRAGQSRTVGVGKSWGITERGFEEINFDSISGTRLFRCDDRVTCDDGRKGIVKLHYTKSTNIEVEWDA